MSLPQWIPTLAIDVLQKRLVRRARLKGLGAVVGLVIAGAAVFGLMHALKNVDYNEVFAAVRRTDSRLIALALMFVAISYASLTLYDLLALRTIGHREVSYRIAALASFTSYPIAHGMGAVALVSPIIRYRVYSHHGLGAVDVAKICFLTGLTFWLGNLTALGLGLLGDPAAVTVFDYLPPVFNRLLAAGLLAGVAAFVIWSWFAPRYIGTRRWAVRLPSGPLVLVQILVGIIDLAAAALAMYVLLPAGSNIEIHRLVTVFIAATLLGFASHAPAGIGVFDATIVLGLGGDDKESMIAALLMFRFVYHLLPFVIALALLGGVEGWRALRAKPKP
jgi:uncharacterized membrane protein YbhN (UPF0104 family)